MERIRRIASSAIVAWMMAAGAALAAPLDFYLNLLRRGIANVEAGQTENGIRELRIAAFGLVESVPHFQTAHIYLAIASDRVKREADARLSATRVVAAERVEARYASLAIPAETRSAFEAIATRLLPADQLAVLRRSPSTGAPVQVIPPAPTIPAPQPMMPAPIPQRVEPPPTSVTVPTPIPTPQPQRVEPQPAPVTVPAPVLTPQQPAPVTVPPSIPAPQPQPQRVEPQPAPVTVPPPIPASQPQRVEPAPAPAPATPAPRTPTRPDTRPPAPATRPPAPEPRATFREAEAAVNRNDLPTARRVYGQLLAQSRERSDLLRAAEGLYRSRDFRGVVDAFDRIGSLRSGEEPYRYYLAVALYETGRYAEAKRALAAALPHIEVTPDVARYRAKIEGAID